MPWHVSRTEQCPADKPFGVILDASGRVIKGGCHGSESDAQAHKRALFANAEALRGAVDAADRFIEAERNTRRRRDLRIVEAKAARDLGATFHRQGAGFLRRFAQHRSHFADGSGSGVLWEPAFDEARIETMRRFQVVTRDLHEAAMLAGARSVADSVGAAWRGREALSTDPAIATAAVSFDTASSRASMWLSQHGASLVSGIDDTTRQRLAQVIADGIASGESYKTIAATITETFAGFSRDRAEMIAVNEAAEAYSFGARSVANELRDAGIALTKTFITANDERVDAPCDGNAADGPIPLDDSFSSGDDWSPIHVNCRCDVVVEPAEASLGAA